MMELGQLQEHHAEFANKNARIIAVSMDTPEDASKTQEQFRDLVILSDPNSSLIESIKAVHPHAGPGGIDATAPTTIILDKDGKIRWIDREDRFIARPSPQEVLSALEKNI